MQESGEYSPMKDFYAVLQETGAFAQSAGANPVKSGASALSYLGRRDSMLCSALSPSTPEAYKRHQADYSGQGYHDRSPEGKIIIRKLKFDVDFYKNNLCN